MRRQVYLSMPGFPAMFQHMYEEPDYGLQCYAAGHAVWFEPSLQIVHAQSAVNREIIRRHHLNARNEVWSVWLRCPWPWLPMVTAYRLGRQFAHGLSMGYEWVVREPLWWWGAFKGIGVCCEQRRSIPWRTYYRWMQLARHPLHTLTDLRTRFPASPSGAAACSRLGSSQTEAQQAPVNHSYSPR